MMTYDESIAWLYSTQSVGIKLGLENITRLLGCLGVETAPRPSSGPVVFHVAGTNGKGSVCALLDSVCRAAGLRTALFTSPHLVSFRERIRLNGAMISEADVAVGLTRIRELIGNWPQHPTFFEIATALALSWFQEQRAEVVVMETGLGGRLDATNAITPAVAVITALSFDHCQYLGNTMEEIAAEKAGIFKPGVLAVSALQPFAAVGVMESAASRLGCSLSWVGKPVPFAVALPGSHQKLNAALALAALAAAGLVISQPHIEQGLAQVVWPGRFQRIEGSEGVSLILDGAHNEAAAARLVQTWRECYGEEQPVVLLGVLRDKDVAAVCRSLAPLRASYITAPVHSIRSCSAEELAQILREATPDVSCHIAASVEEGLACAQSEARATGRRVLVTGSLFLIGETLALLEGAKAEPSAQ